MSWSSPSSALPPTPAELDPRGAESQVLPGAEPASAPPSDFRIAWPERRRAFLRTLEPDRPRPARRRSPWRLSLRVVAALCVVHLLAFNLSVVRGSSMAPGIHDGDRILIDQLSYLFSEVERGDVVVIRYPLDPRLDYIKRVVGLPGDQIAIRDGNVLVNGRPLEEPYVARPDRSCSLEVWVRSGHYFVLGDNRPHSSDSREFGQVPSEYVRGRVDVRIWPPARVGWIH